MAKVKVITKAVVDGNPVGSTLSVDKNDADWLVGIGYADKVVEKSSAKKQSTKSQPKKTDKEAADDKSDSIEEVKSEE